MINPNMTFTVPIQADPEKVYDFVSNGANLPKWAKTFCLSVEADGEDWKAQTPQGPVKIRMAERNDFGVLDHLVIPPEGDPVYVPMRVVPNCCGSEVFFTLFRLPSMSEERYANDLELIRQDLGTLKEVMELGQDQP